MTIAEIVGLLEQGGPVAIAGIFIWLYLQERKDNRTLQAERLSDLRISMDSVHKSIATLEKAMMDRRTG